MLILPLLLLVIVWYLIICIKWKKNIFDTLEKIPGLKWYPIFGSTYFFVGIPRADVMYKTFEVVKKHKPFFKSWNGNFPEVHLMKADHLQTVLRSSAHTPKGPFYQTLFPWLGEGLFISEGAKWFMQRKMLTPTFHFKILENFVEVFGEKGTQLIEKLESKADGKYFNIVPDVAVGTLNIICETAMGVPLKAMTDKPLEYVKYVYDCTELAMWRYLRPYIIDPLFYLLPQGRYFKKIVKELHTFSGKVVAYRKGLLRNGTMTEKVDNIEDSDNKKKRLSFLDLVLDARENKNIMSDSDLKALVDTFIFAGYETTTNTICYTLFLLGNYPEIQEKIYKEVRGVLKDKKSPTSLPELNEMKYLDCAIKETLRLYPVLPFMTRTITETIEIDDYKVPAGTQAIIHTFYIQRDPEHYPDPNKFDPDRFLPENTKTRHPFVYIPFSAGPRNCLGMRFALLEMRSVVATIINKYKITSLVSQEELKLFHHVILRPQTGIHVKLEER